MSHWPRLDAAAALSVNAPVPVIVATFAPVSANCSTSTGAITSIPTRCLAVISRLNRSNASGSGSQLPSCFRRAILIFLLGASCGFGGQWLTPR